MGILNWLLLSLLQLQIILHRHSNSVPSALKHFTFSSKARLRIQSVLPKQCPAKYGFS